MNKPEADPKPKIDSNSSQPLFPVVGIGASAGGLEALELLLSGVPTDSGMAYVIVQHLDPTHKGMMPELLQRATSLPVVQVTDHLKVQPDHVYVLPPNHDISIQQSVLYLSKPAAPRGQRLPIDFFLESLALDQHKKAVAVLLSGMGSDGTEGLRAIKKHAGLVLVQDPTTAAFPSMPQSAIDADLVDIIAPAAELPKRILASLEQVSNVKKDSENRNEQVKSGLDKVLALIQAHNGQDFSLYKKSTLYRRIERRMGVHQLGHISDYVHLLQENAQELDLLFKELLIGVTSFFRDPAAWDSLRDIAFPTLFQRTPSGRALRAWVPACSTGEEAYSIAISFKEALELHQPAGRFSLHIFATDLAQDAVDLARIGHYTKDIDTKVSAERLARYFTATENGYQIAKEVREMVIFAPQNMAQDPPFTKLDLLSCRNVLIYFGPELQQKLLALFHYSLTPGGILFLGNSETVGSTTHLFEALDSKTRIYHRLETSPHTFSVDFPTRLSSFSAESDTSPPALPTKNLQILADQLLLREFAPAAVLVNAGGDIIYICGRTGRYLEPAAGKANWNVYAMARNGLRHPLASALQQVVRDRGRVECHDLSLEDDGKTYLLDLTLLYVEDPEPLHGTVMIVFKELRSKPPAKRQTRKKAQSPLEAQLEKSLEQAQDEVKCLREQMQTSGEELKSANEELQSTNEELQSRVDDLSRVSDDMQNLLNSTEVATIFLDNRLHIRRFTEQAANIIKLISADIGRPLSDLASDLDYPDLAQDAEEVLRTLVFSEKQVTSRKERWFTVRIMPYRTMQNLINGVVITFIDITLAKNLEAELRATVARIENQA